MYSYFLVLTYIMYLHQEIDNAKIIILVYIVFFFYKNKVLIEYMII